MNKSIDYGLPPFRQYSRSLHGNVGGDIIIWRVSMLQVSRVIDFCAGHRLMNYSGNCKFIHGHNFKAVIHVKDSVVNKAGMVIDFNDIRETVKTYIDTTWDHGFFVNYYDRDMVEFLRQNDQKFFMLVPERMFSLHGYSLGDGSFIKEHGVALCNPTVENLSLLLEAEAVRLLEPYFISSAPGIQAQIYESENGWVTTL